MTKFKVIFGSVLILLSAQSTCAFAADDAAPPAQARDSEAIRATFNRMMEELPDLPGTGHFPAIKREDKWFPNHVVYRPADLGVLHGRRLPILLWGNGGCANDGASGRHHLLEVASHGYFAIAPGPIMSGPWSPPLNERPKPPVYVPGGPIVMGSTWQDVDAGLDLAEKANSDPHSPYYQRLDTSKVAVAGHSCGGLQALTVAANDKRIKTVLLHNSGIINSSAMPAMKGMLEKSDLVKIRVPIIYILGGPTDIAYENGTDDFHRLTTVPAVLANIDRGHQATFAETNGGVVAQVAVDWLDWQLLGDKHAGARFLGKDCLLCTDPEWTLERKNL